MYYKLIYTTNGHDQVNTYEDGETARRVYGNCEWKITYGMGKIQAAKLYAVSKSGEELLYSCKRK